MAKSGLEKMARLVGNMSRLFQEFPRRTVYKLSGTNWTIVFVGKGARAENIAEIQHLFFAGEKMTPQKIGRIALWRLPTQCQHWWAEGVDLIVGESSRISPYWPQTPLRFSVPGWVQQVVELPDDLDNLLGNHMKHNVRHAQKANFSWYFSQSKEDFDHFYYKMYVPYIKDRYGSRALMASYTSQWQKFVRGGLIVITQNDTPVGGLVCYIRNKTCYAMDGGVLDGNPDFLKKGIYILFDWFSINWAHQRGVRVFDMGNTRPWRSNGVFDYKSRWRSKVVRTRRIYGVWIFLAQNMPLTLQEHINQIGFISEVKGKFYATLLDTEQLPLSIAEIDRQLSMAQKEGLDGLLLVSANRRRVIPVVTSTGE